MWSDFRSLILVLAILVEAVDSRGSNSDVTWISPSKGQSFGPGDKIPCKWKADKDVVSPSFHLCMMGGGPNAEKRRDDDSEDTGDSTSMDCGEAVWPTVKEDEDESTASITVPEAMADGSYILRMKDDFGWTSETSTFTLSSVRTASSDSSSVPFDGAQAPLGYSNSPSAATAGQSLDSDGASPSATVTSSAESTGTPYPDSTDASATASSQAASSSSKPRLSTSAGPIRPKPTQSDPSRTDVFSSLPATSTSHPANASSTSVTPQDLATLRQPPTAAFAIPLSAIGAILIIAVGLAVRHRRKLSEECTKDAEKLSLSRQSSMYSHKSAGEVQYALGVLSRHEIGYGGAPAPLPLFMPMQRESVRREQRRPTKTAFAPASYATPTLVRSSESVRTSRSRPLLTRCGLSSRSDVHTSLSRSGSATYDGASVTHSVVEDYIMPSPHLPSSLLAAPQRAHIRFEAPGNLASSCYNTYDNKPLPPSPRS